MELNKSTSCSICSNINKICVSVNTGTLLTGSKSLYSHLVDMQCMEILDMWTDDYNMIHVPASFNSIKQAKADPIYDTMKVEDKEPFTASSHNFVNSCLTF